MRSHPQTCIMWQSIKWLTKVILISETVSEIDQSLIRVYAVEYVYRTPFYEKLMTYLDFCCLLLVSTLDNFKGKYFFILIFRLFKILVLLASICSFQSQTILLIIMYKLLANRESFRNNSENSEWFHIVE